MKTPRAILRWTCTAALLAFAVTYPINGTRQLILCHSNDPTITYLTVARGGLGLESREFALHDNPHGWHLYTLQGGTIDWNAQWHRHPRGLNAFVPSWLPMLCLGVPALWLWRSQLRAANAANSKHRPTCNYTLTGLIEGAPCPECGSGGQAWYGRVFWTPSPSTFASLLGRSAQGHPHPTATPTL